VPCSDRFPRCSLGLLTTRSRGVSAGGSLACGSVPVNRMNRDEFYAKLAPLWRLTFRRLASEAQLALQAEDTGPGEAATELMIELACDAVDSEYFHSEDPLEAARFVVSGSRSSRAGRRRSSSAGSRNSAGPAVTGRSAQHEITWIQFADVYLTALDGVAPARPPRLVIGSRHDDSWRGLGRCSGVPAWPT
jgi:hypothetical protein